MLNCAAVPHVAPCIFFPVDGCPDTLMAVLLFYSTNGCPAIHSTNGCPAILLYQWLSCYPTVPMAVLLSYCTNGCPAIQDVGSIIGKVTHVAVSLAIQCM